MILFGIALHSELDLAPKGVVTKPHIQHSYCVWHRWLLLRLIARNHHMKEICAQECASYSDVKAEVFNPSM